jgi:hypothetical protein
LLADAAEPVGLFTAGALAVIRYAKKHGTEHRPWLTTLLARRPTKVAAIALAKRGACLDPHHTGRQPLEELQNLAALQLTPDDHLACCIDA